MSGPFDLLLNDEQLVVINKPCGIMVHGGRRTEDKVFVVQELQKQLGEKVYPIHRLDRATSGLLVFAKNSEAAGFIAAQFRERTVQKTYIAILRGHIDEAGRIDKPLSSEDKKKIQEAQTDYKRLAISEVPYAIGRYPTSRFSLVIAEPKTGRFHQIRRHFAHLRHPIIGDKKHGDVKHNRFFREEWGLGNLFLHARDLQFVHPNGEQHQLSAPLPNMFQEAIEQLEL